MKQIFIDFEGIRHQIVADHKGEDYCMKEKCSLYSFCQKAPVATCNIVAATGYHFEQETYSPKAKKSVKM